MEGESEITITWKDLCSLALNESPSNSQRVQQISPPEGAGPNTRAPKLYWVSNPTTGELRFTAAVETNLSPIEFKKQLKKLKEPAIGPKPTTFSASNQRSVFD